MDRISGLSDELLLKILSFVPTKVAVSTSLLSKRWEYLWMWLPKLKYGPSRKRLESECKRLQYFLDRNLPLHKAPVIESFCLELFGSHFKPENVNLWVVLALSHCVRELKILYDEPYPPKPNILPSNLYTCKSLVYLKLDGGILLDVPRMVSLPFLKTMKLQRVRYINEETLERLLCNCPILEDFVVKLRDRDITMDLRDHDTMGKLTVVVPSLLRLSLYIPYNHDIDRVVIKTPTLKYFKLEDNNYNSHSYLIENMPYLIEAHVAVDCPDIKSLMESIKSVKRLAICSEVMCDQGFVFNQLENLKLCTCKFHSSHQLSPLLKASSNLQGLDLFLMDDHCQVDGMDYWNEPNTVVPECMLLSLQTLNWSRYKGEPPERDIAFYILKHAVHLKTATITSFEAMGEITKFEMIKELALSSRASATCQLIFD